MFHEQTNDLELDCHVVRDELFKGVIRTKFVPTREQLVNNLRIFLLRRWVNPKLSIFFASWPFEIFMCQLEGGIEAIMTVMQFLAFVYLWHMYIGLRAILGK